MSDEFARRENLAITTAKIGDDSVTTLTTKLDQMLQNAMDENDNLRARLAERDERIAALEASDIWVLTREINQYDQDGEYFVAVFAGKPDEPQLASALGCATPLSDAGRHLVEHILKGGGRQSTEDQWYFLREALEEK